MRTRTLEELRHSADLELFTPALQRLDALRTEADPTLRDFFAGDAPLFVARAPGRLDVMGGIADYSGALVLQLPLACATTAILQPRPDPLIEIVSLRGGAPASFSMPLAMLLGDALRSPERLAAWFDARPDERWAAYVVGVVNACLVQRGAALRDELGGFRLLIESSVPEGKGVSSSAALEVACLSVIAARYDVAVSGEEIATAAQWAENHVARAPCGIMDQMTSACGQRDRLLRLRCQPGTVEGHVDIPPGYRFYGIDSGIRHAVTGADYGTVRTAAFMGYRMIAGMAGLSATRAASRVHVDDPRWHGYLANITPAEFVARYEARLPVRMTGAEFLERFGGTTDVVTRVSPERTYAVRQSTAHPVFENARVERFSTLLSALRAEGGEPTAREMGALMYESHASYGACGLGSEGTDRLVELVRDAGAERGLFGAKITGGGSGGTVALFGTERAEPLVHEIALRYAIESGRAAEVFARSGPGAAELGVVVAGWGVGGAE
ncbi:MAG: kinase [Gemmatimonadetes bacterium]|nr:kinase [Gemmatimonadota bacterium]